VIGMLTTNGTQVLTVDRVSPGVDDAVPLLTLNNLAHLMALDLIDRARQDMISTRC